MEQAPLHTALADGPPGGACYWVETTDGVRLRVGGWPGGENGTVLVFPGRTEAIEKYGRIAGMLAPRGYGLLTIDWRGQGLSERLHDDPLMGHVRRFTDYQHDVAALTEVADRLDIGPRPPVIAHSMGGCIALRALIRGFEARAVAFSAPMWGLALTPASSSAAWSLSALARATRAGLRYPPGNGPETRLANLGFTDNMLTRDPDMFDHIKRMVVALPELGLAGPSLHWLHEALIEMRRLRRHPAPRLPAHAAVGSGERIVCPDVIRSRMGHWPGATMDTIEGAEHELMMETPQTRGRFLDAAVALFDAAPRAAAATR